MMIDIHNHVLPSVDDGPNDTKTSIMLLKEAYEEGITDIILTPHYIKTGEYHYSAKQLKQYMDYFQKAIHKLGMNIRLHTGNELYIHSSLDELLLKKEVFTLANSKYVLIEFPFNDYKSSYDDILFNIKASGFKIIIAHPERYRYVLKDDEFINRWISEGYLLQANQNSFFKKETRKILFKWIEEGKLSFVASDAHSAHRRIILRDCYKLIEKKFSKEVAERLFEENPKNILLDKAIKAMPKVSKRFF